MSSDTLINVESLHKCYQIYERPQDRLKQFVLPRLQRLLGKESAQYFREFWALKDVNLRIDRGDTVGIIGRNGSGKSTLLQAICGTLSPTSGNVDVSGRVAALLELGSGFNPEFTGRENVYLNAALLGLTKAEVDVKFSDIEAFAEIGEFIDQPVKTYSSGMYVRLAFAVIAHVDADILVVDEALAVGDAVFTQRCMRYLRKFRERGTLLFVSHDMGAVLSLCDTALWLDSGTVQLIGNPKEVSERYLQFAFQELYGRDATLKSVGSAEQLPGAAVTEKVMVEAPVEHSSTVSYGDILSIEDNLSQANGWTTGSGTVFSVKMVHLGSAGNVVFHGGESVVIQIQAELHNAMNSPILGFIFRDRLGQDLFGENTLAHFSGKPLAVEAGGIIQAEFQFQLPMLPNGQYVVCASLAEGDAKDHVHHHFLHDAIVVNVASSRIRFGLVGIPYTHVELKEL